MEEEVTVAENTSRFVVDAERRTYRALYQDGLDEIAGGAGFLLLALGFWAPAGYRLLMWVAVLLAVIVLTRALGAVKRRLTDRGSGFVRSAPMSIDQWKRLLRAGAIGGAVLGGLYSGVLKDAFPWLPAPWVLMPYAVFIGVFLYRARKTQLARYYALAVVPVVAALASLPVDGAVRGDIVVLNAAVGVGLLVSGGYALHACLRTDPSASRWR